MRSAIIYFIFTCRQELENPLILIHDKKISSLENMVGILELAVKVIVHQVLFYKFMLDISSWKVVIDDLTVFILFTEQ